MNINIECGQRLKKCRLLSGYSQEALGDRVHYRKETVCMFESVRLLKMQLINSLKFYMFVQIIYFVEITIFFPKKKLNLIPLIIKKLIVSTPYLIFIIMNYMRYRKTKTKLLE